MRIVRVPNSSTKTQCDREGCKSKFIKKVHNQKYCSKTCCQKATNEKLLNRYHESKKPVPKNRVCKTRGCKTILSQYNKQDICGPCESKNWKKYFSTK